jgi:Starch-binding associating with outer membrane
MKIQYKNGKLACFMLVLSFFIFSCEDLGDLNIDPTRSSPENFDPNFFLSASQWNYLGATTGYNGPILFQSGWVQILASTTTLGANYYSNMDKYVPSTNTANYQQGAWNNGYRSATLANQILVDTEGKAGFDNLRAIAKIMIILNMQNLTDVYGDIPYSEALKATNQVTQPVYDSQDALYQALLNDLDAAVRSLDASKPGPTADLLYDGNVAKWKKFGYSLMLRMAMRLTKANAASAKSFAEKAAAGGTFASAADDAFIKTDNTNGYSNGNAGPLNTASDFYEVRWSKTMIDYLKSKKDPRLGIIAEVPQDGLAANNNPTLSGNSTPANQLGLPNGFDMAGGATDITTAPGYPGGTGAGSDATKIGKYSRPTAIYRNFNGPLFIVTYAETELLLAEAAVRGFSVTGTAAAHYSNALQGAMLGLAPFGASTVIDPAAVTAYVAANPLDISSADNSIKMINEQYWATTGIFMNFVEAWNNWKRTNHPALTPVKFTGNFSGGTIPRRQPYPTGEAGVNGGSYNRAVSKLPGGDQWTSRTWWDK